MSANKNSSFYIRLYSRYAIFVILLSIAAFSDDFKPATSVNAKPFLGTWQASFNGKPFLTIKLSAAGDKVTGTASHGSVEMNQDGEVTNAEAKEGEDPISNAQVSGNLLRIDSRRASGDSIQFELKLSGSDEAELRILGTPPGETAPKPWKLSRISKSQ